MRFLVQLTILMGSIWVSWQYGYAAGLVFTANPYLALLGYPAVALLPVMVFGRVLDLFHRYPAIRTTAIYRFLAGHIASKLANGCALALLGLGIVGATFVGDAIIPPALWNESVIVRLLALPLVLGSGIALGVLVFGTDKDPLTGFARRTQRLRTILRSVRFSLGGSARFATMLEELCHSYKAGAVFLGRSLFGAGPDIGIHDDRHMLTIGGTRSGKGRSVIIPNMLLWEGSALVIDPKGTIAAVTARRRRNGFGQAVDVLDPFGIVPNHETSRFNPMSQLDPGADDFVEQVYLIVNALVMRSGRDNHWDDTAAMVIAGLVAWLAATMEKRATLRHVLDLLTLDGERFDALLDAMEGSTLGADLPRRAATLLRTAATEERGSILSTAQRHLSWLNSQAMQKVLADTDFDLRDMKQRPGTVYLVLPPEHLDTHSRFLRLFVSMTIDAFAQGGRGKVRLLMLLDEFHALGNLPMMEKAMGLLAGYNICIWPFLQNLSQLKAHYRQNWETFFANAAAVQVFGINDSETADYLVKRLGQWSEQTYNGSGVHQRVANLLQPNELGQEVSRESQQQIVFRNGADPLLLSRANYDAMFDKAEYDRDPDHV